MAGWMVGCKRACTINCTLARLAAAKLAAQLDCALNAGVGHAPKLPNDAHTQEHGLIHFMGQVGSNAGTICVPLPPCKQPSLFLVNVWDVALVSALHNHLQSVQRTGREVVVGVMDKCAWAEGMRPGL